MTTPPGRTRSVVSLAVFAALFLSVSVPAAGAGAKTPPSPTQLRARVLDLVNGTRTGQGLPALRLNRRLSNEALAHSRSMARTGAISHTADLGDLIRNLGGTVFGEDVAKGRGLRGIYDAWLRSSDTRRVLLDPRFREVGLGVVHIDGFYWVTLQAFG
jgi:uncharacterized protein YkwD